MFTYLQSPEEKISQKTQLEQIKLELIDLIKKATANDNACSQHAAAIKELLAAVLNAREKHAFGQASSLLLDFCVDKKNNLVDFAKAIKLFLIKFYNRDLYEKLELNIPYPSNQKPVNEFTYLKDIQALNDVLGFGIAYVTGSALNKYDHALLFVYSRHMENCGLIHVDDVYEYPKYMTMKQFRYYLMNQEKELLAIQGFSQLDVNACIRKLNEIAAVKWFWQGIINNCLSFCFTILEAGGFKRDAFYENLLDLPANVITQTCETHESLLIHFGHGSLLQRENFTADTLKKQNIVNVPVLGKYTATDIKAFLFYVFSNILEIHQCQKNISLMEKSAPGKNNHSLQLLPAPIITHDDIAAERIITKLKIILAEIFSQSTQHSLALNEAEREQLENNYQIIQANDENYSWMNKIRSMAELSCYYKHNENILIM